MVLTLDTNGLRRNGQFEKGLIKELTRLIECFEIDTMCLYERSDMFVMKGVGNLAYPSLVPGIHEATPR